jgi:hypothetical protein
MSGNISPIFSRVADIQGGAVLTTAANDYNGVSINNATVFTADPVNGGYLQRLRIKALGTNTASVLRVYLVGQSVLGEAMIYGTVSMASASQTPSGTPSASGGTLMAGSYYAKIQAVDQYGIPVAWSAESSVATVSGTTGSIGWAWTASTGATSYNIIVGNATGGECYWFTSATNSFTQTAPYATNTNGNVQIASPGDFFPTAIFYGELSLPGTGASATVATPEMDYAMNVALPPGWRVMVGLGTTVAAGWSVCAIGGKY